MNRLFLLALTLVLSTPVLPQTCRDSIPPTTPDSRFTVAGDEVTDRFTGLVWQRCPLGKSDSDCSGIANFYNWKQALAAAQAERDATGKAWRLPDVKELMSIAEKSCYSPAINLTIFPNTPSLHYWSASPYAKNPNYAWHVNFSYGNSYEDFKSYGLCVRLVRDGE